MEVTKMIIEELLHSVFVLIRVYIEPDNCITKIVGIFSSVDEAQAYYDLNHKSEPRRNDYYTDGKYVWDYLLYQYPIDRLTPETAGNKHLCLNFKK
jgi:hypothetical protein